MAVNGDIYFGAIAGHKMSAYGRTLKIDDIEISRSDRAASGKLRKDVIATKKRITLSYELIDESELDWLLDEYENTGEKQLRIFTAENVYDEYLVLMEPIDRSRFRLNAGGLWSGVNVVLNEV